jgi:hypothetical protein
MIERYRHRDFGIEQLEQRRLLSGSPTISIGDAFVTEGNSGTRNALVTVSLSAATNKSVSVGYRTQNGSASAGSDYQAVSGTLTFSRGERTKTIAVPIFGDRAAELDETFAVLLSNPQRAKIADGNGLMVVRDNEPRIIISDAWADEGACRCNGPTPVTFIVSLSTAYDQPVNVNYATADGSATIADGDYDAASGTLTFAPGETSKTITVSAWGDAAVEPDEYFYVRLTGASPFAMLLQPQGIGNVLDDDGAAEEPDPGDPYCTPDHPYWPNC